MSDDFETTEKKIDEATKNVFEDIDDHSDTEESDSSSTLSEVNNEPETQEYSDIEKNAISKGWKPKEQFAGDEDDFVSAREYLGRTELYDKISNQNKSIKKLETVVKEFAEINKKQQDMLSKEKADYFLQQKRQAIESGNIEDAEKFERAYYESQVPLYNQTNVSAPTDINPAAADFAKRNINWFNSDTTENDRMKTFAIEKENYLLKLYPEWSDEKRLAETEKAVKEVYSHRFENKNRTAPSPVNISNPENSSGVKKQKNKVTFNDIPASYKTIVRTMAHYGNLSLDDYAQQLHDTGVF